MECICLYYKIQYLNNRIMSSFQFNFDAPPHEENNLEEIMKKIEQNDSFQFDKFDPVDNGPHQTSANSDDFFQTSAKKQSQQKRQSAKSKSQSRELQFQNSRNINEISIIDNVRNQSFKYEKPISMKDNIDTNNQRYQNLQKLLNKAKTNSLDNFYKNLDQQNTYPQEQKFRNKEEFKMYRSQLKTYKKSLEEDFQNQNGNYNFKHNQYPPIAQPSNNQVNHFFANDNFNFKKKQTKPKSDNDFDFFGESPNPTKGNMFAVAVQPDDFLDDKQLKPQQIKQQLRKYQQIRYKQEVGQFFGQQKSKKKRQKEGKKLQTINEQRANMFEITQQQQKMSKLLNNYQQLKSNFNHLIYNLKETNTDQQKIIHQLKNLKVQYQNKESRLKIQEQTKKEKQIIKEKQKEEKFKKITQIKDEIHKIKQNTDKDLLINKLNQKVQNLQNILKNAIQELHQQKQPKMIPKIINYYNEPQNRPESNRSRASNDVNLSGDGASKSNSEGGRFDQNYYLGPVRKAVKELKEQRRQQSNNFADQFSSPLQLDLSVQDPNISRGYSHQLQHPFVPAQHSKQYLPNGLDSNNRLLRRCLTQKSSILFESFQFYVTGKYTITGNERFPVTCQVRVANKCAINLYDIFVIVYGPQAQSAQLQMRPSKIMYDEFKYNTSFLFEVDLSKSCIQVGSFSIQLSYKTDSVNKKKVNFKAVLPFAQLIKPEFIYEEQFTNAWNHMENQYYVKPKLLDFKNIRSHQDLKLILPFMEINEPDPNSFSYGIMFSYPKSATIFMLKVTCYVSGKASIHLKSNQANQNVDKRLRQQILDIICYLVYG